VLLHGFRICLADPRNAALLRFLLLLLLILLQLLRRWLLLV
jgi:hypothetical protein